MGRTKETERPRYAAKVRDYLARFGAGDPQAQDLSLAGIAKGARVSRTPLSEEAEDCAIIQGLLGEINEARRVQRGEAPGGTSGVRIESIGPTAGNRGRDDTGKAAREETRGRVIPGLDLLENRVILKRIRDQKVVAEKAMADWISRHGVHGSDDVGLAAHDLDRLLSTLRRVIDDLVPLLGVREARETQSATAPAGVVRDKQPALDL